jgi:hypothetical protein
VAALALIDVERMESSFRSPLLTAGKDARDELELPVIGNSLSRVNNPHPVLRQLR